MIWGLITKKTLQIINFNINSKSQNKFVTADSWIPNINLYNPLEKSKTIENLTSHSKPISFKRNFASSQEAKRYK